MKRKLLYSFFIAAAMSFSGCSSFLEENPVDQMPESEAYKNPEMIYLNTVANLYTKIGADAGGSGLAGTDRGLYDLNTFCADDAILPTRGGDWDDGGLWRDLFTHNWGVNNGLIISTWDYLYGVIVQCNQSIDKLTELKELDPSNEYFDIYKAEVRGIRAMYYYYLLDMFARVPIVESSLTQMKDVKQSERSEVFNFVKKELEESIPLLADEKSADQGEYYGRMTKAAAYFLMAKLALNAEVYTDNDWTDQSRPDGKNIKFTVDGTEKNCWEATVAYCDKIKECGYSLNQGTNGFLSNFVVNNEGSKENIFVIPMDPTLYKARNMYLVRSRHYDVGKALGREFGISFVQKSVSWFDFSTCTGSASGLFSKKEYAVSAAQMFMMKLCMERCLECTMFALFLSRSLIHSMMYLLRSMILSHMDMSLFFMLALNPCTRCMPLSKRSSKSVCLMYPLSAKTFP